MAYYLGIDGGGSKTACVVGNDHSVLATVTTGPSNIIRVGESRARESLHDAIRQACAAAKIDPRDVQSICVGAAGAGRKEIASIVRKIVAEAIAGEIQVVGDMQIALHAALADGPGVIVVAGTGSIAYARDTQGKTVRAGGWGYAISDEGSAHWIGRAAVAAVLRAADEGINQKQSEQDASTLFNELKNAWKLDSLEQLARAANSNPDFAILLPALLAAAGQGNVLAERVLKQAAEELAQIAKIVIRWLTDNDSNLHSIPLAIAGGVFRHAASVQEHFCSEISKLDSRLAVRPGIVEPVLGALEMVRNSTARSR
ncbi:MAG: BadF/BadG/BcrA/BcrD ATPase family protein [Candidatus Sulfotelmatobacter sp.]